MSTTFHQVVDGLILVILGKDATVIMLCRTANSPLVEGTVRPSRKASTVIDQRETERNWAGNHRYQALLMAHPSSVAELQGLVATAGKIRALGSRHSFNGIADTPGTLVVLDKLDGGISVDTQNLTVTVGGGTRYGTLAAELQRQGFALHNLASLPHISVAGAVATATHGSGDGNGNLATAVAALELVTADGSILTARRGDPDFAGMVVGLGALGIVSRLTLDIEPSFAIAQSVYEDLDWEQVLTRFDELTASAYSVSLFTDWSAASPTRTVRKELHPAARRSGALVRQAGPLPDGIHPQQGRRTPERISHPAGACS
jgi:FAD/FMN-containing dehydrogenase